MKVVVTGGAGFIGANLSARLAQIAGMEVIVIDDLSTGDARNLRGVPARFVEGSILDEDLLGSVLRGASAIVHLAARPSVPRSLDNPAASHHANSTGTMSVLEAARHSKVEHVVVASSSSVYGANPELPKHEGMSTRPLSPYAASKLATESYALAWQHSFGLGVLALRFFNVFGPLQGAGHAYAAVVPALISAALEGRALPVHGDGQQTRDFTYVDSVTRVIADAVQRRVTHPGPVNLAFGTRTSLLEIVAMLETILGKRLERQHFPSRSGDVRHSQASDHLLRSLFPRAIPIPLEAALRATVDWFETSHIPMDP